MRDVVLSEQFSGATSGEVARGILAALEARGVRLVPVEATIQMRHEGCITQRMYADFLAASPYAPEGGA